ncbi:LamG-like jellyroll fold domain-containing protein [Actinoplanes sp. NPDC023936]|uniref:LamG-like jellyroll fold domain-containing protein n=1 Tax=Actinoplanes sp. NPDC023936 TaxID=3154910 RepID=UPI0033C3AAB5
MSTHERAEIFSRWNAGRRLAVVRQACLVVVMLLLVTLADLPRRAVAAPPAQQAPAAKPACPDSREDVVSAAIAAKLCGARVEAIGRRTETTQVFANPDGTITEDRATAPVRVKNGDKWDDVDLTLIRDADGSVVPRVHARDLKLSGPQTGAGEHEVVSLGEGEQRTSVSWKGPLPEPVLDGRTATYPDVLPGVDIVVKAQMTGYEQYFVAKDRAALRRITKLTLPMSTGKLTASPDAAGGLTFKDGKGRAVGRAQAPEMWDAEVAPLAQEHVNRAPVGLRTVKKSAGKATMELTADPDFVERDDLRFPVTIDPPASLPVAFDAFVQNSYSSDQSGATELKLGHVVDGGSYTARSYLRFNSSGLAGSRIVSAKLRLWETHSWSCTAVSWEAWRTDYVDASVRWTAQPAAREKVGTSTETKGYSSSCADGYVYIEIGKALQVSADNSWATANLMLRATTETDTRSWKKFDSSEAVHPPVVTITYNAAPAVPSALAVAPCYSACGAGAATTALRPTLSAKLADSNAGQALRAEFELRNKATAAVVATSGVLSGSWTNGSTASWQVGVNLANATTYQWRVRAKDPYNDGAWSGWSDLTVDTDKPLVPFVAATIYKNDGQPHGGAGQSDTFTFTPASGTADLAAFVYKLDTDASATTVAATGVKTVTLSPRDGQRTLTVQAKDRAGNLSAANVYTFSAGNAALAQPLPGATVVKRTKLQITTPVTGYTRAYFEYRRGPGAVTLPIPSANLTSATGAPITATAASPVAFSALGGHAIWNAADTLGAVGGVVEVRARIYTATATAPVYDTAWVRVTVDSGGDGGATEDIGPGEVNLLTGDLGLDSTDADELDLSAGRTASSRTPAGGYVPMPEKLTANQQQVSTDLTGFTVPATSTAVRSTARGQGDVTPVDSIEITPAATGTSNDTYVALGGDTGAMRLGMQPGKTYRITGWIYVPAATGLAPAHINNGLRIVAWHRTGTAAYVPVPSPMAAYTEGWQELSVDMTIPAGATEALVRLYNGNAAASGKKVYWDNISVTEIVAPFGPSWNGGATGGAADTDYTTLTFPSPSVARLNTIGGSWLTFSRNADGVSYTPQPGSEDLTLTKPDATTFRLTELDGTVAQFKQQGGVWTVTSTWTAEDDSTTKYVYDTSGGRLLLKKVINPVEPGVDDTFGCAGSTLPRGCEVLEYVYATATSAGLSQTVFGDYTDRVSAVKIWNWDPAAGTVNGVEVAKYAYDNLGRLREVWDPRVTPALKTSYEYDGANRVTKATPPGELPWMFDYANPDVDTAALRWNLDGNGTDSSGAGRNGTATGVSWGEGNDPKNPGDRAAVFTGATTTQITAAGTPLSNTASYTVAAWARITDTSVNRTVVSKDGASTSGFFLNYVAADNKWAFSRVTADNESATPIRATSNVPPTVGQWTHLAGVYDTASGKMKLYVNGVLQNTTAATGGWNAGGNYVVGRAKWAGANANAFAGSIDDVRIYGAALTDAQVADLAGDENTGRLIRVRRAALKQGSTTETDGEVSTHLVYNVPLTRSAGGPYDMNAAAIGAWGQTDLPTDATAIFGPENVPSRSSATAASPGVNGYPWANVHYLNANGQEVNTATPGGDIDTSEFDRFGNVVRSLEASNRTLALGTLPGADTMLAELGLLDSDSASRAQALSTVNRYSTDGLDLLDTVSPTMTMVLEQPLADPDDAGPLEAISAGQTVIGRAKQINTYDEGKPDGANYHLVTTETDGAVIDGYPLADVRVSKNYYDAEKGGTSGWKLKEPTKVVADAVTGGAQLTAYAVFNARGQVLKSQGIGSSGEDARATETIYYTAGANSADDECGNRPEWAGEVCVVRAAGAITGADADRMATQLPVRRVIAFNRFGDELEVEETAAGQARRTVTEYDAATRVTSTRITSDQGAPVPAVTTAYDPASGDVTTTTMDGATITREYDRLGRLAAYTDADGARTVNEFDRFGKSVKVSDPTGFSTFAYDRTQDPRGQLTSVTDSVAGTFTTKYSPDGQLTELKYPGGLTRVDKLDANLQPVERTYTRDADGAVIYSESVVENSAGQWINHKYTGGNKTYGYDRMGRLVKAQQDSDITAGCVTRAYDYDDRTNRTGKQTYDPDAEGLCNTDGAESATTHTYDTADRITDAGYEYDAFGRTTKMPGGLTNSYYANDLIQRQQLDDSRQTWTLDPAHRFRGFTTETSVDGAWTNSTSKLNHYGDDSDEPRWTVEDTTLGTITRNVSGPDGDLAATTSGDGQVTLQLTNLHGDIAVTIDAALTEPQLYDYDEFGAPMDGQAGQRYGWLGGKQRSGEAIGGVILMGVRLYSPAIGRFLQTDPIDGGNATAYDYCAGDPVNCTDLDGQFGWGSIKRGLSKVAKVASYASMIPGPIGTIAGVVSAVSYAATGNWREAAWAAAGAAAAVVGAGAAVKGVRWAVKGARAAKRARCNSFTGDTPVLMADGSYLPIADVRVGDLVMAVDPATGATFAKPVLATFVGEGTKHLVELEFGDAGTLTATGEHPVWLEGRGWIDAEDVRAGDLVRTAEGVTHPVRAVRDRGWLAGQLVFNLNVGDVHTFVVSAGGIDVLVHNASCNLPKKFIRAPRKRGVYVIKYSNGKTYVGKSRNIHRRMHQHNKKGKLKNATSVRYHIRNKGSLKKLEQGVLNRHWHARGRPTAWKSIFTNLIRASRKYSHF